MKLPMGNALVIIPTYNERDNLPALTEEILAQDERLSVLVVDDGSPDGTGEVAKELADRSDRIDLIERGSKQGLGTAYIEGFRYALAHGYELAFEMDADFSHDPGHLRDFLKLAEEYDLVIGSRYVSGVTVVNWPMKRLLLSYLANRYARIITGLPFNDLTSGFKCYHRRVLEALDLGSIRSNGYSFQIETVFRAQHAGFRLTEIPIVFTDRNIGSSKMSRKIIWEAVWMVWRMRWWHITGRLDREVQRS